MDTVEVVLVSCPECQTELEIPRPRGNEAHSGACLCGWRWHVDSEGKVDGNGKHEDGQRCICCGRDECQGGD